MSSKKRNRQLPSNSVTAKQVSARDGRDLVVERRTVTVSGPVPAEYFREIDQVSPGAGTRMLDTADEQSHARMRNDRDMVVNGNRAQIYGITCGLAVALSMVIGGIYCVLQGHDTAGASIAGAAAACLTGVFVYGKASESRERIEKAKLLPPG